MSLQKFLPASSNLYTTRKCFYCYWKETQHFPLVWVTCCSHFNFDVIYIATLLRSLIGYVLNAGLPLKATQKLQLIPTAAAELLRRPGYLNTSLLLYGNITVCYKLFPTLHSKRRLLLPLKNVWIELKVSERLLASMLFGLVFEI